MTDETLIEPKDPMQILVDAHVALDEEIDTANVTGMSDTLYIQRQKQNRVIVKTEITRAASQGNVIAREYADACGWRVALAA